MSLNLADYAGNMGHKDQQMALKWVDKNIKRFGGGGRTTLLGHDSGMTANLFIHNCIVNVLS